MITTRLLLFTLMGSIATPAHPLSQYYLTDLGSLNPIGLNSKGQVVRECYGSSGLHALLWSPITPNNINGSIVDLGELPGGNDYSSGRSVNVVGQVVGQSNMSTGYHAFLWSPNAANGTTGTMIDLGDFPGNS